MGFLLVSRFLLVSSWFLLVSGFLVVSVGSRMASRNSEWNANGFSVGFKVSVCFFWFLFGFCWFLLVSVGFCLFPNGQSEFRMVC